MIKMNSENYYFGNENKSHLDESWIFLGRITFKYFLIPREVCYNLTLYDKLAIYEPRIYTLLVQHSIFHDKKICMISIFSNSRSILHISSDSRKLSVKLTQPLMYFYCSVTVH
jgi:hypothetical protein